MQVSDINDIKIYNLSCGKSLPEWLSDRKRRQLLKRDVEMRRRIELIQDFAMPTVSGNVKLSKNGEFVMATGVYKPRLRCYDLKQLSMKFERCFDSEAVRCEILSDDYTKFVVLQCDRYVEFHNQGGRYHRLRIPKFGHDMCYHQSLCDLYLVGDGPHVHRLNLEQGRFLSPFESTAASINVCRVNPAHGLLVCGTQEGHVEAWDPRARERVGRLDCALGVVNVDASVDGVPAVSALSFRDGLNLAVGTSTGQILLYDVRASKPYLCKDHLYGLPIKDVQFVDGDDNGLDLVVSMDAKIIKLWRRTDGRPYTAIQAESDFNGLCLVPKSGMLFVANEAPKLLTYYIPSVGPAPRWCAFLDRITEELEEGEGAVYDDYKFVTSRELDDLGLTHLVGTGLLRAYMHGFFVDARLYNKARAASQPFAYEEYRKRKIRERIEAERANRVQVRSLLPAVNKAFAEKLIEEERAAEEKKATTKTTKVTTPKTSLLRDDRFKALFENADFEIDERSEEYRLLQPLVSKLDKSRLAKEEREKDAVGEEARRRAARHFADLMDDDSSEADEDDAEEDDVDEPVAVNDSDAALSD